MPCVFVLFDDSFGGQTEADQLDNVFGTLATGYVALCTPVFDGSERYAEMYRKRFLCHAGCGDKVTDGQSSVNSSACFFDIFRRLFLTFAFYTFLRIRQNK